MVLSYDVALLAPVPLEHLESGRKTCLSAGKVGFGSRAWETFSKIDALRAGLPVVVYIYASHSEKPLGSKVSWRAYYIGHVRSEHLPLSYEQQFRPRSTDQHSDDTRTYWPLFWEVIDLQPLVTPIPINQFSGLGRKKPFQKMFVPEGPLLVEYPYTETEASA